MLAESEDSKYQWKPFNKSVPLKFRKKLHGDDFKLILKYLHFSDLQNSKDSLCKIRWGLASLFNGISPFGFDIK